ncbi:hypothetical protein DER45DRAFT_511742 [Fusarium avenaceum]|nr:hypothetical protein DER45DRAFT_511742 [Fusarium avenaceum]
MSSESQPLRQIGIYRNLPTFDPNIRGLKAIICGANGISGFNTLRALLDSPDRWSSIFTLSRSGLSDEQWGLIEPDLRSRVRHVPVNLSSSPQDIGATLKEHNVSADYVFYYTYAQPRNEGMSGMDPAMADKLCEANVPLLDNFLQALEQVNLIPKRILIQTGGKNYGMHIGRIRLPAVESDPQPRHLLPNFYYPMEDSLKEFCKQHPETHWNVIRPAGIIGVTHNSPLNAFYPFAVYAAVQAHKNEPLYFGSDFQSWQFETCYSTARLTGYLSEWAVLEDKCADQAFNAQDGAGLTWDRFYEELARWFGVKHGVVGPCLEDEKFSNQQLAGDKKSPLGYGPPATLRTSHKLEDWFKDPVNNSAWEEIMQKNPEIKNNVFQDGSMDDMMHDFAFIAFGNLAVNKLRRFGFCGFVDSLESLYEMYQELHSFGMLPKLKAESARPLI